MFRHVKDDVSMVFPVIRGNQTDEVKMLNVVILQTRCKDKEWLSLIPGMNTLTGYAANMVIR